MLVLVIGCGKSAEQGVEDSSLVDESYSPEDSTLENEAIDTNNPILCNQIKNSRTREKCFSYFIKKMEPTPCEQIVPINTFLSICGDSGKVGRYEDFNWNSQTATMESKEVFFPKLCQVTIDGAIVGGFRVTDRNEQDILKMNKISKNGRDFFIDSMTTASFFTKRKIGVGQYLQISTIGSYQEKCNQDKLITILSLVYDNDPANNLRS